MIILKNINLLISTSRYNETNAKAELWFSLLMFGDKYPIITNLEYSGLIAALSNIVTKEYIMYLKKIYSEDPDFFKYILKVIPIDFVCDTDLKSIAQIVEENYKNHIKHGDSYKIALKRRKNEIIERERLITRVTRNITNPVDLNNPDKIIRIEMLGAFCGISFLNPGEIFKLNTKKNLD